MGGVCWWVESVMWVWPGWFVVPKTFMIIFFMAVLHFSDIGSVWWWVESVMLV